ncbi:tensin-2-like isoform X2 [Nerophis lumbriciformis]|uniref:tensin-2-like isoform X2 n=1 Tax=Nerophis lumbriciformis TaxID=546530 RepID=UPI002ADF942D|nr:tensin-2-like isoform X2 [Nerophis lumbriciformis]
MLQVSPTCASTPEQHNSVTSTSLKKRGSMPRSKSEERVMDQVMERHYDLDLTYITERIISVFFMPELEEPRYGSYLQEMASMLKSKHQDKFLLLNLSEKRHDITRLNPKVQDLGWPDLHAPPLDGICSVCKTMETWLGADPHNVVVLHCKGHPGKTAVIVAAFMHYNRISAGVDQALTTLAMRKFCEDKVSSSLQPSQRRYIYYFAGLLSGTIKMNSSPLFLHHILIPSLSNFQTGGGYFPFVKIYQSLQLIYTSCVYNPQSSRARKLCVTMEPALLLKGDIMVKCYHRRSQAAEREVIFRIQFHTCTIHGAQLWFGKNELDVACSDDRFPLDAAVEFIFSSGPEKLNENQKPDASVKVDDNISDPVVRWDSYENFHLHHKDSTENISHTIGPVDGSLYAQVRKRRGAGRTSSANGCLARSPTVEPLSGTSGRVPGDRPENPTAPAAHPERKNAECPTAKTRQKLGGREKERETEVLEGGYPSSVGGLRREHRCGPRCGGVAQWEPCLSNSHCAGCLNADKKSQTLPAVPLEPISPPPHLTRLDLCHRHSLHPLPELPWQRSLSCLHGPCYPYSPPELPHPHSHTLPAPGRHEERQVFHCSGQAPPTHVSHQALPSGPYREMFFGPPSPGCPCRECSGRREHRMRAFHPMHPEQAAALWESRSPDFWQSAMPPFHICHAATLDQGANPEQPRFFLGPRQSFPSPQCLVDMRDGASSGYHTPPLPHQSCPCSPHQASPVESHESRGYLSGSPASSPSPGRGGLPETPPGCGDQQNPDLKERSKPSAEVDLSQGSKGKPDRSSTQTLDSDHDYTLISPPHTEDSVNAATTPSPAAKTEAGSFNITQLSRSPPDAKVKGSEEDPDRFQSTTIIITPVQDQVRGSDLQCEDPAENMRSVNLSASTSPGSSNTTPNHHSSTKRSLSAPEPTGSRPSPEREDTKPPSPTPDGYHTPTFPTASYCVLSVPQVPYTGYTAVTIQPPLPEKKRLSSTPGPLNGHASLPVPSPTHNATLSPSAGELRKFISREDVGVNGKFVQDGSKFWYKASISRDQAIAALKDKEPGTFLIRDSNSFQGAYGLALKVATPPASANATGSKADVQEQLVRHFLIETGPRGVKIKGCQNESYFGSLSALVYQHSITPISLPCALRVPERDLLGELQETRTATNASTAADLLKQGAACSVLYLNSVETESLTGPEAVSKAAKCTLALSPRPSATVVHFKVSCQGITLTDSKRRLFFRRHYPISSVTFSSLDPQDQRMFGFVARRTSSSTENVCHLFAEMDPEQPAVAIVNFINKVMLGPQLRR